MLKRLADLIRSKTDGLVGPFNFECDVYGVTLDVIGSFDNDITGSWYEVEGVRVGGVDIMTLIDGDVINEIEKAAKECWQKS